MEYRILGPLEVIRDGESLDLGTHRQRSLLALLLINANHTVTTDRILEELWGDDAAGKEKTLWVYISRLRGVLEPDRKDRGEPGIIVTRAHGYALTVDPDGIDAACFEDAAARGAAMVRDDPAGASRVLGAALAMWRGDALEDFTYEEFTRKESVRLEELRLAAVENRIEADLRRGMSGELVAELEAVQQANPLRERLVGQLMLALYRSGRQAEALRTYERFRRYIGDEMGVEPSPELRRLEEQILLHDSRIQGRRPDVHTVSAGGAGANPFKGLRPFGEGDVADFFGRDRLVADVLRRIQDGARLIALVGPSGSGKSSLVRAGIVPSARKGGLDGSAEWLVAQMVPASHPFAELEVALQRATLDAPDSLRPQLADPETGILRAALRVLPNDDARLLLVIDQFEELFTLVEDQETRHRFLAQLLPAVTDPHGRIVVVLTLRADFYDRPLVHPEFGAALGDGVVNVVPMLPDELEVAAQQPVSRVGAAIEPALLAALITDVVGQPGSLPLFQYTLTELFDRRSDDVLGLEAYRAMGGVEGALTTRAEDLYGRLDEEQRGAAKQLFLRLVSIADGDEWSRRRVVAAEITSLPVDVVALQEVIDLYARHRLLTLDRDEVNGSPTVEVAHEALLTGWERLRRWIEDAREDVRRHRALTSALVEWRETGEDPGYLLEGSRLEGYERWAATATMQLTTDERAYLDASIRTRAQGRAAEERRLAAEARLARAARRRLWGFAVSLAVLVGVVGVVVWSALPVPPPDAALLFDGEAGDAAFSDLFFDAHSRVTRELGADVERVLVPNPDSGRRELERLSELGVPLIILPSTFAPDARELAPAHPDVHYVVIDDPEASPRREESDLANYTRVLFAEAEGSFLVGAAAALTTETGTIGFLGGVYPIVQAFEAGFEAGARHVDPDIEVLSVYLTSFPDFSGFSSPTLGYLGATDLYRAGADVVYHAGAAAGFGLFEAAADLAEAEDRQLWAIGVDKDQYESLGDIGRAEAARWRPHILTSMVKRIDEAIYTVVEEQLAGTLQRGGVRVFGLAEGGVDYVTSGGFLSSAVGRLEELRAAIVAGAIDVPSERLAPPQLLVDVGLEWMGE